MHKLKSLLTATMAASLAACASNIEPVGMLGPNKLKVFVIKNNDFLSASRMLVILDKNGNVSAYSGGTVAGAGAAGLQSLDTVASAAAVVVGANAIQHGLQNTKVTGIPNHVSVNATHKIDVSGTIK